MVKINKTAIGECGLGRKKVYNRTTLVKGGRMEKDHIIPTKEYLTPKEPRGSFFLPKKWKGGEDKW